MNAAEIQSSDDLFFLTGNREPADIPIRSDDMNLNGDENSIFSENSPAVIVEQRVIDVVEVDLVNERTRMV